MRIGTQHVNRRQMGVCDEQLIRTPFDSYWLVSTGISSYGPGIDGVMNEKPVVITEVKGDLEDNQPNDIVADMEANSQPRMEEEPDITGGGFTGSGLRIAGDRRMAQHRRYMSMPRTALGSRLAGVINKRDVATSGNGFYPRTRGNILPEGRGVLTTGRGILTDVVHPRHEPKFYAKARKHLGPLSHDPMAGYGRRKHHKGRGLAPAGAGLHIAGSGLLPAEFLKKKIMRELRKQKKRLGAKLMA